MSDKYLGEQGARNSKDVRKREEELASSKRWKRLFLKIKKFSLDGLWNVWWGMEGNKAREA